MINKRETTNIAEEFGDFSKTIAALSSKPFLVTDITQISNEGKDTYTCVDQRFSGNFIGARALLGVFTYICRQRPIIH